jgi:fructose-1,6-bisphosphatase
MKVFPGKSYLPLACFSNNCYIQNRGYEMAAKVKPVQPTEIKDIRIIREAIAQIRRKPTAAALKRHKEQEEELMRLLKK